MKVDVQVAFVLTLKYKESNFSSENGNFCMFKHYCHLHIEKFYL